MPLERASTRARTEPRFGLALGVPHRPANGLRTGRRDAPLLRGSARNRDGPLEEILKLWDSKDRNDVRKTASDPAVFEANRQFFRSITSSRLLAKIDYGAYAIFFIAHSIPSDKGLC